LAGVDIDAGERLDTLRREEHSVTHGAVNLIDYYYCASANQPHEVAWMIQISERGYPQYYKAYDTESRFVFIGEAGWPVQLSLACRLSPSATEEAAIFLEVNGQRQGKMTIGREWTTWDIAVDGGVLRDGLNEIVVRWPIPRFEGNAALERTVQNMCERKFPDFYPIFGEIHSFTACNARQANPATVIESELATVEVG
jgi:hypothetical protein